MSGELDESCNYHYKGGLSKHALSAEPLPYLALPPPPSRSRRRAFSTVHLDPLHQTQQQEKDLLAKIVAMQLKPELLVEQIIIENRLRTMNVGNHDVRHLNLEGMGVDPRAIPKLDKGVWLQATKASKSMPVLSSMTQHRKTKRRKRSPPNTHLNWCTLNADSAREDSNTGPGQLGGLNSAFGGHRTGQVDAVMGEDYGIETEVDHMTMEKSFIQTRQALAETTSYRLPKLQVTSSTLQNSQSPQATFQRPLNPQVTPTVPPRPLHQNIYDAMERQHAPSHSFNIPVVSPSLRAGVGGLDRSWKGTEPTWKPDKVKYTSKLRSLGW
jgi:hypothetical protein